MILEVERAHLIAAQTFKAYGDVRYYLNGIYFDNDGSLVSTDGHRCFIGKHNSKVKKPMIIQIKNKVPNSFDLAQIDTKQGIIYYLNENKERVKADLIEVVDGRFPDYKRVIPKKANEFVSEIGFNGEYLLDVFKLAKIFNVRVAGIKINLPSDPTTAAIFEYNEDAKVIVMPMRL